MIWNRKRKTNNEQQEFVLSADQIKPLVSEKMGGCIATNKITKEGFPVRFMYRLTPHNNMDSGWHFMSGYEDDDYMNNPSNHAIYAVNTIANYDNTIIPHLETPANCAFEKTPEEQKFSQVFDFDFSE
ncbi:MAG: DUF2185 domain-containing protein [Hellea sp.]